MKLEDTYKIHLKAINEQQLELRLSPISQKTARLAPNDKTFFLMALIELAKREGGNAHPLAAYFEHRQDWQEANSIANEADFIIKKVKLLQTEIRQEEEEHFFEDGIYLLTLSDPKWMSQISKQEQAWISKAYPYTNEQARSRILDINPAINQDAVLAEIRQEVEFINEDSYIDFISINGWDLSTNMAPLIEMMAIKNKNQITSMELKGNRLKSLPPFVFQFKNLLRLDLSNNALTEIPSGISALKDLEVLIVNDNLIKSLPISLNRLSKLSILEAENNELKQLPSLKGLNELTELKLSGNLLEQINEDVGELNKLDQLGLSHNLLSSLPKSIYRLQHLEKLHLAANKFQAILPELVVLESLQQLNLSANQISALPNWIAEFGQYNINDHLELNLSFNPLQEVNNLEEIFFSEEFLSSYVSTKILIQIDGNGIKEFPTWIDKNNEQIAFEYSE